MRLTLLFKDKGSDGEGLASEIRKIYPKLEFIDFEIMRAVSGGHGKLLVRISPQVAVPSVMDISTIVGTSIVYVRPLTEIISVSNNK